MIALIAAMDRNRGIGFNGKLPWHLPADLRFFKETTWGHTVLMGRKTYESIGKPLPNRTNRVLTRNASFHAEGVQAVHSLEDALRGTDGETLFVIGGAELFRQTLPDADRLVLTRIDHSFAADTFFPEVAAEQWRVSSRAPGHQDERNPYPFEFVIYDRV